LGYFAATYGTDPVLTKVVSAGLFTMEAMQNGTEWSLPVSNRAVHDLFFDLKIGPYEHLGRWNFVRFVRDNAKTFVGICLAALFVFAYTISLSILVRRRTNMLCQALEERDSIEAMVKASRDHINNLERTGIVGQMSTMIAHELKQPLGAITNFANGMLRRVKRGNIDEATLTQVLEEIVEQGTRASEIVNRVRAYAKHQTPELRLEDMSLAIEKAIETFKRSRRTSSEISTIIPPYLWAEIDAWELELAVLNLLKNAADSLVGVEDAQIEVYVHPEDRFWRIEVSDNGAPITQDQVDKFMQPLVTSKKHGLGLGLSIVGNIVERHHGRLSGVANADRGVTMIVDIPRKNAEADQNSPQNETKLENFSA
jgi:two-component system sensor histidine kinase TtrS